MLNIQTSKRNSTQPLIFLFGPTGVGKTALLQTLFHTNYSIINADSKQIYRHLDIGSAKPDESMLSSIPHYLVNIKDPWEPFSVGDFVHLADASLETIAQHSHTPIVCGGTAYYFKHFYFGLPKSPKSDAVVRQFIAEKVEKFGTTWAYDELVRIDPQAAQKIHPRDMYRVTRALEVYESTGKPLSSYEVPSTPRNNMDPLIIGLAREKENLNKRIETRVDQMIEDGLMDEINQLLEMGATSEWPGMQGIGYREYFTLMDANKFSLDAMRALIIRNSQKYAKRQMTFFRSLPKVQWVHPDEIKTINQLVSDYLA
jgi:tRNA dimethylallyltransferase